MEKLKIFIKTTVLGGLLVVLPIYILVLVFKWFFEFVIDNIRPIVYVLIQTVRLHEFIASILAIVITLLLFFAIGLAVRTRLGKFTFDFIEINFLKKLPFYKIIKDTVLQLVGSEKNLFKAVALVNLYGNETLITAFVTEEHDNGMYSVFVPSGPAPTAGFIYHLKKEQVHIIDYQVDKAMKTVFSLGAGSNELTKLLNK
ncbi:MAG: DUF502 domain-containing protein [Bacteroidetes bacterium]|nr:DUF502 domain-containing protein [Bacteroidota bacterium]